MSSDSEDDCYGNVAQQLQSLKNKYVDDKIDSALLLNDSAELDEIVKNNVVPAKQTRKSVGRPKKTAASEAASDLPDVTPDISTQNTSKRATRSSTRNSDLVEAPTQELPPNRSRRKNNANTTQNTTCEAPTSSRGNARGRGRSRGRRNGNIRMWLQSPRGRRRNTQLLEQLMSFMDYASNSDGIPTYSVGNTEEYNDQSDGQALFSNKPKQPDVVVVEEDHSEENEELNVKVYWTSSEYYKFTIRRFQKLTQIFEYFSNKENVMFDKLLFRLNGKIIKPDDTPDSIGYTISKIIDGGIVEQGVSDLIPVNSKTDGVKLKFQCQNMKKPLELSVGEEEKFSVIMMKVAEHLEMSLEKLKFEFDGDSITGKSTVKELELEGGECIDVKIIR